MMHGSSKLIFLFLTFLFLVQANDYKWDIELGTDITGGVIIDNNYAYVTSRNTLTRINLIEQKSEWEIQTEKTTMEPIRYGGLILVPVMEGKIYQINVGTNKIIKEIEFESEITANPLLSGNNIYVPTKESLICIDANSGNEVWKTKINTVTLVKPIDTTDNIVLLGNDGFIVAIAKSNGRVVFNDLKYADTFWKSGGEVNGNLLVFGGEKGKIYVVSEKNPKLTYLNQQTVDGTPLSSTPSFIEKDILYTTQGGKICRMTSTGNHVWCLSLSSACTSKPIVTEKWIYAITNDGNVYGIDYNGTNNFVHHTGASVLKDVKKVGSMIYLTSKEGRLIVVSTSSCDVIYPNHNEDVSGIEELDVEIKAFADTEINEVSIRINNGRWIRAEIVGDKYVTKVSAEEFLFENNIYCKVTSTDGEEKPPYSNIYVTKTGQGKRMSIDVPSFIGYKSSYNLAIKDENGNPLDRCVVIFDGEVFRDVNGEITLQPRNKGEKSLEIRRPGYIPIKSTIKVDDDYTLIIVAVVILGLLSVYAFMIYRKWMRE